MLSLRIFAFLFCLLPLVTSAQAVTYFELDLKDLSAAQEVYPDWIDEITEQGGEFDAEHGWRIQAGKPFGVGRLYLSINREHLSQDLALSFFSGSTANIAVQLYDADERTLAVDLLAARSIFEASSLTSLVIPISKYPAVKHVVLRRLDGDVSISSLSLIELSETAPQSEVSLAQLATLLGDPLSPENPLVTSLRGQTTPEAIEALLTTQSIASQPLVRHPR